ncbi:MAG: outer membrane beta-barrel family protein [Cyclobacteriaceae bacterium]
MKRILLIGLGLTMFNLAIGQATIGNGRLSGTITDPTTDQPVEYATIAIIDPITNKPINGTVADGKGKFLVKGIPNGKFNVAISFIGFETINRSIEVSDRNDDIDLGNVSLSPSVEILNEITVEGEKSLIEERVDRMIYNAENDITTKGGDASDVLRRVPNLSVDLDGNISIRGSENIRVLINNRPSTITAGSIADALKQIPADEIKSVEVITSPSAKYDAEGTSGIINIITKKTVLEGATMNVNSSFGNRGSNLGLRGGYKKGKLGLSLGGWGRYGYNTLGSFENTQITNPGSLNEITTLQSADTRSNHLRARYTLGLDYDLNKNNYFTSSIQFGGRGSKDYQDLLLTERFENGVQDQTNLRDVFSDNNSKSLDVNFNYTHLYPQKDKELSILGLYSNDDGTNDFENTLLNENDFSIASRIKNINGSTNEEYAVQTDFQTPIGENQLVEVGGKQTIRKALSDYQYFSSTGTDSYVINTDKNLSNAFNYRQDVSAGYLSYTLNLKKYSFKAGGRYEYTTINAFFQDEADILIPSYGVFVPSVNIGKKFKNNNMLKAAFNRRIQRPSIRFLNPNIQASNPLNISIGNPTLDPEYTDNYELSYSTLYKGANLNFTGFMRNTNNSIQRVSDIIGDTIRTTYLNIGDEKAYGMSLNINLILNDKISVNTGSELYYLTLSNNVADPIYSANNEGWVFSGRIFGSYKLTDTWSLQTFAFIHGNRVQLQGTRGGYRMYSLGINKDLPNKRGSIGFGAENFLGNSITIKSETISPIINQQSTTVRQNLNFKVNVNLRFGKIEGNTRSSSPRRSRRTITNDDVKDGDGGGGQDSGGEQPSFSPTQSRAATKAAAKKVKSDPKAEANPVGVWTYNIESPQGGGGTLTLTNEGGVYSGTVVNSRNNTETPLKNIKLEGNGLSFDYEATFGPNTNSVSVQLVIIDNSFEGTMSVGQFGTFPVKGTRDSK